MKNSPHELLFPKEKTLFCSLARFRQHRRSIDLIRFIQQQQQKVKHLKSVWNEEWKAAKSDSGAYSYTLVCSLYRDVLCSFLSPV